MLNPHAIAVQGLGYTPRLAAAQGLANVDIVVPPIVVEDTISGYGARPMVRVPVPSFVQLIDEDDLLLLCAAGMIAAGLLS